MKPYFTLYELFASNSQSEVLTVINDKNLSNNFVSILFILQELRDICGIPIVVNSLYRNMRHNEKVGGSSTSQHLTASAVDIRPLDGAVDNLLKAIEVVHLKGFPVGQVIRYDNFVHIGLSCPRHPSFKLYHYENGKLKEMA